MHPKSPDWQVETERGPDWLFMRLQGPPQGSTANLADTIWEVVDKGFIYRVVLEFDDQTQLHADAVGQLTELRSRITARRGTLRLCGLSDTSREVLNSTEDGDTLPVYECRHDAVMGVSNPRQPR